MDGNENSTELSPEITSRVRGTLPLGFSDFYNPVRETMWKELAGCIAIIFFGIFLVVNGFGLLVPGTESPGFVWIGSIFVGIGLILQPKRK